jgi:hypothetical protein
MNCLEFHRQKLGDPRRLSAEAQTHAQGCADCLTFARSVDDAEAQLQQGLATPVPEGLADRVLLRVHASGRPAWRAWALAASVVIGVALTFVLLQTTPSGEYARLAIEHVVDEPESFRMLYNTEPAVIGEAMRSVGATLKEPIGRVRYVRLCPLEQGGTGWHIVFETPEGLVTLILVPGKHPGSMQVASASGWSALIRPIPHGYYAVVTASSRTTSRADRVIRERIDMGA